MRENIDDHDVDSLVRIARNLDVRFKADHIWLKGMSPLAIRLRPSPCMARCGRRCTHASARSWKRPVSWPTAAIWARWFFLKRCSKCS
jgi:hypothetical protein